MSRVVRTIRGDLEPSDLGPCDSQEHLFLVARLQPGDDLDDLAKAIKEARSLVLAGAAALVEWTPLELGRNLPPPDAVRGGRVRGRGGRARPAGRAICVHTEYGTMGLQDVERLERLYRRQTRPRDAPSRTFWRRDARLPHERARAAAGVAS